jgi:probable F420-dependent oxidoreductase
MTERVGGRAAASTLGRFGAWNFAFQANPASVAQSAVADLEAMGYGAVWIPESVGSKEAMSHAALLLGGGERIVIATGIANIYARDPMAMANGARTLNEAYPGDLPGLGVSHAPPAAARGGPTQPGATMRAYLDAMEAAWPDRKHRRPLLAASAAMPELSAERTDGAHLFRAGRTYGYGPLILARACLAVEMTAVLETDPSEARRIARAFARTTCAAQLRQQPATTVYG